MHPALQKNRSPVGSCDWPGPEKGLLDPGQQPGSPDHNRNHRLLFPASHPPAFLQELVFKISHTLVCSRESGSNAPESLLKASSTSTNLNPADHSWAHASTPLALCPAAECESRKLSQVTGAHPACSCEEPGPTEGLRPSAHPPICPSIPTAHISPTLAIPRPWPRSWGHSGTDMSDWWGLQKEVGAQGSGVREVSPGEQRLS